MIRSVVHAGAGTGPSMFNPTDPPLSPRAYRFLSDLVHEHSRIRLGPDRQALVAGRLAQRIRTLGLDGYDAYCDLLASATGGEEVGFLVDLISTNHTHFFREPAHFEILARHVLPALVADRGRIGRPLEVWSSAASSGEEAYSLAIALAEFRRGRPDAAWRVHATDISRRMLERCRAGIYEADRVSVPDPAFLPRYFLRGFGAREGSYRVKPELRTAVAVERVNLFQPVLPFAGRFDVIFCRNVMIYFDAASRQELVTRLSDMLAPGGHLFVGHAESLMGLEHGLVARWPSVYERIA
jgi:chemotaxis protein methyltransferase CheR